MPVAIDKEKLDELRKRIAALHALISQTTKHLGHRVDELGVELIALNLELEAILGAPGEPKDPPPVIDPGVLPFALAPAFLEGGAYAYLGTPEIPDEFELAGWFGLKHTGSAPASFSHRVLVGNDEWIEHTDHTKTPPVKKVEHGPKWTIRAYDFEGLVEDLEIWRAGDFTMGREGHALYANVLGSLILRDLLLVENGGQGVQLVWRASETKVPAKDWHHGAHTIRLERVRCVDCGLINTGTAVRASWPISIANPGQTVEVVDCSVEQLDAPIGHGALFVGDGYGPTPALYVENLVVRLLNSDRAAVRLHNVKGALLYGLDLVGDNRVALADDCGRVEISKPVTPVRVCIHHAGPDVHHAPYQEFDVPAGSTWVWQEGVVLELDVEVSS